MNKYVQLSFAGLGLLTWILVAKFLGFVFEVTFPDWNLPLLGEQFRVATLIGLLAGAAVFIGLRMSAPINEFGREVATELSKVSWPKLKEVKTSTTVVIITSLVVALILGLFDWIWGTLTSFIYSA
jgi:preprotein translocase subunit SecE